MSTHDRYTHEAMKTTFTLHLRNDDPQLARQVAHACIALIDEIEAKLRMAEQHRQETLDNKVQTA